MIAGDMMKRKYETPYVEVIVINNKDILSTSPTIGEEEGTGMDVYW